jgi:hypothetical protein
VLVQVLVVDLGWVADCLN